MNHIYCILHLILVVHEGLWKALCLLKMYGIFKKKGGLRQILSLKLHCNYR